MNGNPTLWGVEVAAQQLADEMVRSVAVTIASVGLWDQPTFALTVKGVSTLRPLSRPAAVGARIPLSIAPWHRAVFERREPVFLEQDSPERAMSPQELGLALPSELQTLYLIPILFGDEIVGVLSLGEARSREREPFGEERRRRCRAIVGEFLVESAHAWETGRLRRQVRTMSSLIQIVKEILEVRSHQDILGRLASKVSDWVGVPVRGVLLRARAGGAMEIIGRWRFPERATEGDAAQLLLALVRAEGHREGPISVVKVAEDPLDPLYSAAKDGETWTRLCLPFLKGDRLLGIACFYVEEDLYLAHWELEAFRWLAEATAVGMGVVTTVEEQRAEQERLGRTAWELLIVYQRALVAALQAASPSPPEDALGSLDINEVVGRTVETAQAKWGHASSRGGRPVRLDFEPAPEPLMAENAAVLLGVLVHLIESAAQALPEGGRVRIRTERAEGQVVVSIAAAGPGDERRGEAPGLPADRPWSRSGLDLARTRALVTGYGGEVTAASDETGHATLVCRLPAADA